MAKTRPATHAGSWYSSNAHTLGAKIKHYFENAQNSSSSLSGENTQSAIPGVRVLVAPHAGFSYSGDRLAESFNVWDTTKVKRVFILGPSHHVYFKNKVLLSEFDEYETPLGNVPIDTETVNALLHKSKSFKYMSEEVDEDEHSFEMHAPFLYYATKDLPQGVPKIVPILISSMDSQLSKNVVDALLPYLDNEENHFIVSSDFCHWGSRFGYTKYLPTTDTPLSDLLDLSRSHRVNLPVHKSIEALDHSAMKIASSGSSADWDSYIKQTGNTICGQKPISVVLKLLEAGKKPANGFKWIGYSQSNAARDYSDSSVSYASGYVQLK